MFKRRRRMQTNGDGQGNDAAGMMRWLLTYADLITLLMVFFVVMYAMSVANQKKFNALKASLQVALHTNGAGDNPIMDYIGETPNTPLNVETTGENNAFLEIIRRVQDNVADKQSVLFYIDERGLTIRFMESVLFDLGKADIRSDAGTVLNTVGAALKVTENHIRIEGHADDLPIHTAQFPSNWELSAARSIAVTRYLIERHGMDPQRFSSLGYGEYHPLYSNITDDNRAKNRRVDIVVLRSAKAGGEINERK